MKKILTIALLTVAGVAFAACPPPTRYDCQHSANGKMSCGCRF